MSFQQYFFLMSPEPKFVGLSNYVFMIFSDPAFQYSLRVTALFTATSVIFEMGIGFVLAILLRREFRGQSIVRTLIIIPIMVSSVAVGYLWRYMYLPKYGLIDTVLHSIGIATPAWTTDPNTALLSLVVVDIWQYTPFVSLILLVGLNSVPREPLESAAIDGASRWQTFVHITLPMMSSTIAVAVLFRLTDCIRYFDQGYIITGGGPGYETYTISLYIYLTGLTGVYNISYAAAMSWAMNFISLFACLLLIRTVLRPSK
jgi:multiple sugar transport system permease protein